jgi:hypothetical protein
MDNFTLIYKDGVPASGGKQQKKGSAFGTAVLPGQYRHQVATTLRDRVDAEKKPIPIQTFMKDVHKQYYEWGKYWGDDCKSLLTTIGLNMSVEQLVLRAGLSTFRKVLCGDLLPNVLKFLFGETNNSYRTRILKPMYSRGDYPELVAAGQIWNRHIVVMQPAPSQSKMTQTRFILQELPISQRNTTYLVRVNNNHYHVCDFRKGLQVDTTARLLLPSGSEEMNRRYDVSAMPTYSQSMKSPFWGQGDIPELVAARRMIGGHIKVMVHHLVTDGFLTTILISIDGLDVRRHNTLHLLRVADRRFHALELAPLDESPVEPSTIPQGPSDSSWFYMFDNNSNNIQQTITV